MNNIEKVLDKIGRSLLDGLKALLPVAVLAEPFVDTAFPVVAGVYNATVGSIAAAKQAATNALDPTKSDVQNFAAATTAVTPILTAYAKTAGLAAPTQDVIMKYVADLLTDLKANPLPTAPTAPATTTTS
jgi:hypothetical protein